jgi:hypothetical protein
MRFVWMAGVCLLALCTPTQGQTPAGRNHAALTHVRGTTALLQALIADTAEKSPAFRAMLDRLEASTVIVYVRIAPMPTLTLEGRTAFLKVDTPAPDARLLVVELSCSRPILAQTATLAHELRHAIEIADAPWVVGPKTLEQYYAQIGFRLDSIGGPLRFETVAAREAAARVRRELAARAPTRAGPSARIHAPAAGSAPDRCNRWGCIWP